VGYSTLVRQIRLQKALILVLLSVIDYKGVYTSVYFIITNFHTEYKPQVKVRSAIGMNSPAFTIYTRDGQSFANYADSTVMNHSVCQQHTYFCQARKHGGKPPLKIFRPTWKNVFDIANYLT